MTSTSASTDSPGNGTLPDLFLPLKPSFRPADFERVMQTLNARDEAAKRETAYWKAQHDSMEKKHAEMVLQKLIDKDEMKTLERERDLLRNQVARAESDVRSLNERMEEDRKTRMARFKEDEERYQRLWEDFCKVEREKAGLVGKVSELEFEREKAVREAEDGRRRFGDWERRISRLEEDAAMLMGSGTGVEERSGVTAADELVVDGREGRNGGDGSSDEDLTDLPVKQSGVTAANPADELVVDGREGRNGGDGSREENLTDLPVIENDGGSVVVIKIDDSDDDMPTRKRGLPNDASENVQPTKKKSLVDLLDAAASDSSHTGDSSSSGSDGDSKSEIARLCGKFAEKKTWAFKADMLSALEREPELCMNAVCALYRKQLRRVGLVGGSSLSMNEGFYKFEAVRGTRWGRYLTDGDLQGKLKRSVSELQAYDPKGLDECKQLAIRHSDRLFEIYQKKQDAFFLPS